MEVLSSAEFLTRSYSEAYNQLPDVEKVWKEVTEKGNLGSFYDKIRALAVLHDVLDMIGIRLAHRHWELDKREIMFEREEKMKTELVSITRAFPLEAIENTIVPLWWFYNQVNEQYEGAEFTSDNEVFKVYSALADKGAFFRDFLKIAKEFGFQRALVPIIMTKQSMIEDSEDTYLELNVNKESIVSRTPKKAIKNKVIPTSWRLKTDFNFEQACQTGCDTCCEVNYAGVHDAIHCGEYHSK